MNFAVIEQQKEIKAEKIFTVDWTRDGGRKLYKAYILVITVKSPYG